MTTYLSLSLETGLDWTGLDGVSEKRGKAVCLTGELFHAFFPFSFFRALISCMEKSTETNGAIMQS